MGTDRGRYGTSRPHKQCIMRHRIEMWISRLVVMCYVTFSTPDELKVKGHHGDFQYHVRAGF